MKDDRLYLIHIAECIERVWNILQKDLPALKKAVQRMLQT
jgi:uncharacterized protein with HEPN domain